MKELLLVFGLMSMGYLAQSFIGEALNESCSIYEEIATDSRNKASDKALIQNQAESQRQLSVEALNLAQDLAPIVNGRSKLALAGSQQAQVFLSPMPELSDVHVTQTSPKTHRTVR